MITRAREVFDKFDWESSGTLAKEDLIPALTDTGKHTDQAFVDKILTHLGVSDGTLTIRFAEFIKLVEACTEAESQNGGRSEEEKAAFASSFQWLGGDPDNPESTISKDTIRKVLQDFELNDDVDTVLGSHGPAGSPTAGTRFLKESLSLEDLQNAFDEH
eukprot:CAMPEP_0172169118 /NCGR_PEP_ID=MMETSP1050-20130122/10526_1 /TAXON_ID=233186 /ORGANISM="Cryptomonas curvata, Strain CCAP979/52" /LENGTH=159 /DNA_ID=CAMNT_0012840137 /DNA_START=135 /DNA_END=614 /DNA_ORIENTATION=-